MILLRMIPWEAQFQHMQARVMFGMNDLQLGWLEEDPMPEGLVDDIMAALVAEPPAPAPEDDGLSETSSAASLRPQMSRETALLQVEAVEGQVRELRTEMDERMTRMEALLEKLASKQ